MLYIFIYLIEYLFTDIEEMINFFCSLFTANIKKSCNYNLNTVLCNIYLQQLTGSPGPPGSPGVGGVDWAGRPGSPRSPSGPGSPLGPGGPGGP